MKKIIPKEFAENLIKELTEKMLNSGHRVTKRMIIQIALFEVQRAVDLTRRLAFRFNEQAKLYLDDLYLDPYDEVIIWQRIRTELNKMYKVSNDKYEKSRKNKVKTNR